MTWKARAEAAEKKLADTRLWRQTLADTCDELRAERDYQRRHRKWALIEARIKRDDASILEGQKCLFETSAEAAEQRVHELEAQRDRLREALGNLISYTEACEGLLNATPAGQVTAARAALEEKP